jgi:hypothetical protein
MSRSRIGPVGVMANHARRCLGLGERCRFGADGGAVALARAGGKAGGFVLIRGSSGMFWVDFV